MPAVYLRPFRILKYGSSRNNVGFFLRVHHVLAKNPVTQRMMIPTIPTANNGIADPVSFGTSVSIGAAMV